MGGVPGFDPVNEHEKNRAALRAVVPRLVRLLGEVPDHDASSGAPVWTVGDAGTRLAAVYVAYCSIVSADGTVEWDTVLLPGEALFTERIAAMNAKSIDLLGGDGHARPGGFVAERGETFLRVTEGLAPDTPVNVPWYGQGTTTTPATVTGLMLSESLVHGLDIARRRPCACWSPSGARRPGRRSREAGSRQWPATRLGDLVAIPCLVASP